MDAKHPVHPRKPPCVLKVILQKWEGKQAKSGLMKDTSIDNGASHVQ
jgi:hypothetical protein